MSLWVDVSDARVAAGRLWLPQLSLDYMGRDVASFTVPNDFDFNGINDPQVLGPTGGFIYRDFYNLNVCYPDSWDVDATYITSMRLDIVLQLYATVSGGSTPTVTVEIEDGDNEQVVAETASPGGYYNFYRTYTSSLPTGATAHMIRWKCSGGTNGETVTLYADRAMGDRGPDSFYQIRLTT